MTEELTLPDVNRCQGETRQKTPFRLGGPAITVTRCNNQPVYIAFENEPGGDGQQGAMSLCEECKEAFIAQLGPKYAALTRIRRRTPVNT